LEHEELQMGWIKLAGKTLEYAGKIAQAEGFEEWATNQGKGLIEQLALKRGFTVLGAERAVRHDLWKELQIAAASDALKAAIQAEVAAFPKLLTTLAWRVDGWPASEDYKYVYAVPRLLVNEAAVVQVRRSLENSDELSRLTGAGALREYFFNQLVLELDRALTTKKFSPSDPFALGDSWLIIGIDPTFRWVSQEPYGHYYLFEHTGGAIGRQERPEVEKKVAQLAAKLGRMSAPEKEKIITTLRGKMAPIIQDKSQ
jgi:hypothetical protein